jgi:hypothetical protein
MTVRALLVPGLYTRHLSLGLQTSDATAPSFTVTPFASSIQDTSIQVRTTISEESFPATFYVVVLADGATAPSEAQIRAGTDSTDSAAPSGNQTYISDGATVSVVVGGLTAETAYDVYYTSRDAFDNDSTAAFFNVTTVAADTDTTLDLSSKLIRDVISQELVTDL